MTTARAFNPPPRRGRPVGSTFLELYPQDGWKRSTPPEGAAIQVACVDGHGRYILPFACTFSDGAYLNARWGDRIDAKVVAWRPWRQGSP